MSKICKFRDASKNCTNQDCIDCGRFCSINEFGGDCDLFVPEDEVVAAEVVEAAPAPAHAAGPTFAVQVSHRTVELPAAQALSVQFARVGKTAGAAVREMVVFGAMLEKTDDALTKDRYNPDGRGEQWQSQRHRRAARCGKILPRRRRRVCS